jgi:adenine-specific DNA-methyltransferase
MLNMNGELIFIVPSDFLKLTSSRALLIEMLETGTFTHIIHPDKEDLFEHANVDVIVFRYCKNAALPPKVLVNGSTKFLVNVNGVVTFSDAKKRSLVPLGDDFDIYVGMVSGKESVFKNPELGGVDILNGNGVVEKYIMAEKFPTENEKRKFHENNWFQWGALRNIEVVRARMGEPCIYVKTLTRATEVCFVGKVQLCGGGLIMMIPKKKMNLNKLVAKLNSEGFRENYLYSGRFKIGHNQLCNAVV